MDITAANFAASLPLICESINSADFVALDTEFSGLSIDFNTEKHTFDTIEDRY